MKKELDENLIKEKLRQAYSRVDNQITPSRFDHDWECASYRLGQGPENNLIRKLSGSFNIKLLPGGVYGFSIALAFLLVLTVLFVARQPTDVQVLESTDNEEINVMLDPNNAWYMPTDDLLQVGVLRYEYQWVTFVSYDPITMEIR